MKHQIESFAASQRYCRLYTPVAPVTVTLHRGGLSPVILTLHRGGVHCRNTANVTESMKLPAQPAVITTAFEGQIRHRRCTLFLISFKVLHKVYL